MKINTFWLGPPVLPPGPPVQPVGPPAILHKFHQLLMKINTFWVGPLVRPFTPPLLKLISSVLSNLQSSIVEEVGGRGGSL